MPLKTRITNAVGRIVAAKLSGSRRFYQHDALGSATALINEAATVTDTYAYWPYGELRASTGTTTNPYKFCGAWGYYADITGRTYVRARTLKTTLSRWMTVDPLWPGESPYVYADASPISVADWSGLKPCAERCVCPDLFYINHGVEHDMYLKLCPGGYIDCAKNEYGRECETWLSKNGNTGCAKAKERLEGLIGTCGTPNQNIKRENAKAAALTLCCPAGSEDEFGNYRDKGIFCGTYCCKEFFSKSNPCVNKCVKEHEDKHKEDCPRHKVPEAEQMPESCPYLIEILCLHETFKDVCRWGPLNDDNWPGYSACKASAGNCDRKRKR